MLRWGTGALNIDGCRYAYGDEAWPGPREKSWEGNLEPRNVEGAVYGYATYDKLTKQRPPHDLGRWPANIYACPKASRSERERGCEHLATKTGGDVTCRAEGSAGLDNPRSGAQRSHGVHNHHPTVKPVALMRWLCRLVTPPGGTVLDTFTGSGTTGIAALAEGFAFVGVEREAEYIEIARARIRGDAPLLNRETA